MNADSRPAPPAPYQPLTTRAAWASFFLLAVGVLNLLALLDGGFTLLVLRDQAAGRLPSPELLSAYQTLIRLWSVVSVIAGIGAVIAFLTWFYRGHKNLRALGNEDLEYKSGWAIGGFLVPFLNLVRPLQVMREIWYGSDPCLAGDSATFLEQGARRGTPAAVGWWWGLFLGMRIVERMVEGWSREIDRTANPTPGDYEVLAWATMAAGIPPFVAALMAVRLIWTITRRQSQRHDLLEGRAVSPEGSRANADPPALT